ncbi:hypothetical protein Tco_0385868 [Tanacetum coccineum]
MNVDVPMNQPQPVVSTQETHRSTPRAHRTPTLTASPQGKKRKQTSKESSSPRKSLKITIKKKKQSTTPIPPLGDDRERDEIADATIPSLTLHKTDLAAEAQENIAKVQEKLDEEEIERWLKVTKMKNHMQKDEEIEKEEKDNNVEKTDEVVKEKYIVDDVTGSMEIRKEQKFRGIDTSQHLTYHPISATTSKDPINNKTERKDSIAICRSMILETQAVRLVSMRRQARIVLMLSDSNKFHKIREVLDHCNKVVPEITFAKTNEMIKQEMPHLVNLTINKHREVDPINAQALIAKEFASHGPKMIEELFRKHMQNTTLNLYPTTSSLTTRKSSADLQHQLYLNMKSKPQDQAADLEIWEILKAKFEKQ